MLSLGCSTSALAGQPKQSHLLVQMKGNVQVVSKGGKPSKGFLGNALDFLSTLFLGKNASAKVTCSDGSTKSVSSPGKSNTIESICKNAKRTIITRETTSYTRGEQTLTDADRLEIDADVKNLQQQPIDDDAKGIAIAYLYQSKGLYKKAIEELETLVDKKSQTTAVYQLLGSIYQQRKIDRLAIFRYRTGLKLAIKEENVEAQKYIQEQLKVLTKVTK
jgi:tetratricopeptide (TPR) repeat protein